MKARETILGALLIWLEMCIIEFHNLGIIHTQSLVFACNFDFEAWYSTVQNCYVTYLSISITMRLTRDESKRNNIWSKINSWNFLTLNFIIYCLWHNSDSNVLSRDEIKRNNIWININDSNL